MPKGRTSKLTRILLLDRAVVEKAHRDRRVDSEAVERIRRASPLLGQALDQDTDDDLCELYHPRLVCEDNVLEILTREVRPQVRAGQEATSLRIICWDLPTYNECLNAGLCQHLLLSASMHVNSLITHLLRVRQQIPLVLLDERRLPAPKGSAHGLADVDILALLLGQCKEALAALKSLVQL